MYDKLKSILINDLQLKADDLRPEATLDEAGLDSLALVELSIVLSKRYGIEIGDDELIETGTVAEIAELLARQASSRLAQASS